MPDRSALVLAAINRWNAKHPPSQDIDPDAAMRVAGAEGLSGGIGDGGHAFGPWQLNDAGGVVTGKLSGSPQQRNAWAWSPKGLDFALGGLAGAAGGQHGSQAVTSIVRKFERPADPDGEISRALGGHAPTTGGAAMSSPSVGMAAAPGNTSDPRRAFAQALLGAVNDKGIISQGGLVGAIQARREATSSFPAMPQAPTSAPSVSAPARRGGIAELLREGTGGPTHSTGPHIHAAFTDPNLELSAIRWAQQHGLHVGENPYTGDTVDPVHAPNSYHTRTFPGMFNGRKLGQAIDVSGGNTNPFYAWLAGQR